MRYQQNPVPHGNTQKRNEPDNGRNADYARGHGYGCHAADEGKRQIDHDHARQGEAFEFLEEQQEYDQQSDGRCER